MELDEILESLRAGRLSVAGAQKLLSIYSIEKVENFAKIDAGRKNRRGIPEVVFAEGKQLDEVKKIIQRSMKRSNEVLVSRIRSGDYAKIVGFAKKTGLRMDRGKNSSSILFYKKPIRETRGKVGIICAGTSDIGVAEEARLMCKSMNCRSICSYDVGIAGMQRLFPVLRELVSQDVDAAIVVAGMEGALATVVSSLMDIPVIGVPSSVGYGYGSRGVAALAAMLQSCALGMSVVNIDNGIGAGAVAANISRRIHRKRNAVKNHKSGDRP